MQVHLMPKEKLVSSESSLTTVNIFTPKYRKLIIPLSGGHEMSVTFTELEDGQWAAVLPDSAMTQMKQDFVKMYKDSGFRLDSDKFLEIREVE